MEKERKRKKERQEKRGEDMFEWQGSRQTKLAVTTNRRWKEQINKRV